MIRVRFAPSPTGFLHIGGLRTALYNYLFAKNEGGKFILRIEDTDAARFVPEAFQDITESLRWAGIEWEEGPDVGGAFAPYVQSERAEIYRKYAHTLVENGHAYYAFDTPEAWEAKKEALIAKGVHQPKYDAAVRMEMENSLTLSKAETARRIAEGVPHTIRLKMPESGTIVVDDIIRGEVRFDVQQSDDQVLLKSDGLPTYHLANIVDDHEMEITHVIRGEEWLSSVPKHMYLYQCFGWEAPRFAHLSLILSPSGGKLSKRKADEAGIFVSVKDYRAAGYLPQALCNFLALLGWNDGTEREVYDSIADMIPVFSLSRVNPSPVQFSMEKLDWFQQQHFKSIDKAIIVKDLAQSFADKLTPTQLQEALTLMQERIHFSHSLNDYPYLWEAPTTYEEKPMSKAIKPDTAALLNDFIQKISDLADFSPQPLESSLHEVVEAQGLGVGRLMMPVRLALTGVGSGAGIYDLMTFFGKSESLARLTQFANRIA